MYDSLRRTVLVAACGALLACTGSEVAGVDRSEILPLTAADFSALLSESRGDVILVNLWATWCAPCLKEIPELVELEQNLAERGFRLIGVSLDDLDAGEKVRSFRDEWFPDFSTYHIADDDWYSVVGLVEPKWSSVLPTSFIIDRDGGLAATVTGGQDYAAFEAAVAPLL